MPGLRVRRVPLDEQMTDVQAAPSFRQQRQWFVEQLVPEVPVHVLAWRAELSGPVDTPALRRALAALVARHEALRTSLATADGVPVQRVGPAAELPLTVLDLGAVPAPEQAARVAELSRADARRGFDLAGGPLLRVTLLRLAADRHVLAVTAHQAALDWWSVRELATELAELHHSYRGGQPAFAGPSGRAGSRSGATRLPMPLRWSCPPTGCGPGHRAGSARWSGGRSPRGPSTACGGSPRPPESTCGPR